MAESTGGRRDILAGALMALVGAGAAAEGQAYHIGSLTRMGPGFMPFVLGVILIFLGALMAIGGRLADPAQREHPEPGHTLVGPFDWRGGPAIIIGVLAFIVLGAYAGLVPAIFACVFLSALGDRSRTVKDGLVLALLVTAFGVALFSFALKVPFPLLRW